MVIGDSWTGEQRPTFGVFAWSVVASGEFALTPAMAVADACLIVSAPGLSYFAEGKQAFEPLPAGEGSAVALVALAGSPHCPTIPALRLKSVGPARAISGLLILSSKDGLPFEMANDRFSRWLPLAANVEGELQPPEFQVIELPFGSDLETWFPESTGFERVPVDPSKYEHSEAVRRRNFEVFDFRELRKAQERRLAACGPIDGHRLMLRLVSFPEANPSPDARDVYLRKHDGGELIIPLGGLVAAHLHDTNNGAVNAALNNGQECDLIQVVEEEGSYVPVILNGPANRSGNSGTLDNSLIFDASRVLHGFSAASRVALMLCVSVRRAACSGEWIARTSLGEPDHNIRSGGAA